MSKKMGKKKGLGKFLLGAGIGAGLGILFAPKSGKETRKQLKEKLDELIEKAKEVDIDEVKEYIETKVFEIKTELEDLDKEKVMKIAKEKSKQLLEKANELVDYSIEKGTPILEKTADAVRTKTIEVTKEVLAKLEAQDKKTK